MKKKCLIPTLLLLALLFTAACNRFYTNPDFLAKTRSHKTVAILPFQIMITGRLPKDLTPEMKRQIEEAESIAFQRSYYSQVHVVGARAKRELTVTVQPADRTNQILKDKGISIADSWDRDPQQLAQLLGVDAVIRNKATKQRYLSDLESIGVQVSANVLNMLLGAGFWLGSSRTSDVEVSSNIIAASTGENLFSGRDEATVDWSVPANEAVEQINHRIARRFPYVTKGR